MTWPDVNRQRGGELLDRFANLQVVVVGDAMLDRFIVGRVTRISPEAPVPVVQFDSDHVRLGGAANVAHNILALGGRALLIGVVGRDQAAIQLRKQLAAAGGLAEGLVEDPGRPTTEKVRIVTEKNQQVARIDYECDADVADPVEDEIVGRIRQYGPGARALLVSDYLKGAVTRRVVEALLEVRAAAPLLVDPKIPHLPYYRGATLVTPNHHEAEAATGRHLRSDEEAREAARDFHRRAGCDNVLITRGEHGMWLLTRDGEAAIPSVAREVSDVTGAGDTVVATLALALGAGATIAEAAVLANYAAGIVVGKFGPATVAPAELLSAMQP